MLTPGKTKEKPSIASKKVLNTHRKNGTESYLLTKKIKSLEHKQSQKNIDIDMEMNNLKKRIETVQRIKKKIGLSTERRMLLKSQGFTIRICKGEQEDDIVLRRESLQVEAGNWAALLTNPPDFTTKTESLELQGADESIEGCSSTSDSRPNERPRSHSFSSVTDCRPTQVSRYRVIEPPLRPGSRRGFSSMSTALIAKKDQENCQESNDELSMPTSERASRLDFVRNRPFSGRSLFVDAVIAARNSNYFENNNTVSTPLGLSENYRRRKYIASRRTKSAPTVKVRHPTTTSKEDKLHKPGDADGKKRLGSCPEVKSSLRHNQKDLSETNLGETVGLSEQKQEMSVGNKTIFESSLFGKSELKRHKEEEQEGSRLSTAINASKKLYSKDFALDRNESFEGEIKAKAGQGERDNESHDTLNESSINNKKNCEERSKTVNKLNEFFPIQTSQVSNREDDADNLNPLPINEPEVVLLEDSDVEKCLKSKQEKRIVESETSVQETSGRAYLSLPDQMSRVSLTHRRNSTDSEMYGKNRFHGNARVRKRCENKDLEGKGNVTFEMPTSGLVDRRMSHPPWIMINEVDKRTDGRMKKRKSLKNEDEVVYAYDARPDKSLAKGYRAMQMTVGGRQVKLSMPAFSKATK